MSPLDVRWCVGLCPCEGDAVSERGKDEPRPDPPDDSYPWRDMRLTRSVLPLAGRLCLPSVGDELCER